MVILLVLLAPGTKGISLGFRHSDKKLAMKMKCDPMCQILELHNLLPAGRPEPHIYNPSCQEYDPGAGPPPMLLKFSGN
jgi:hypothetical protein